MWHRVCSCKRNPSLGLACMRARKHAHAICEYIFTCRDLVSSPVVQIVQLHGPGLKLDTCIARHLNQLLLAV